MARPLLIAACLVAGCASTPSGPESAPAPPPASAAPAAPAPAQPGTPPPPAPGAAAAGALAPEQLEALVSPVALFPDPLLGQVFEAATRLPQVLEAAKWVQANPGVTGKDLDAALQGQPWDASVKAMVSFPDVMKMMTEHQDWARDLGDAYRTQRDAVLYAVQQLRARALAAGNLASSPQQTVKVEAVPEAQADGGTAGDTIIRIEPANPQVIYVPTYSPTVVYGTWAYPAYPPPPVYPPGYVAGAAMVSFSIGFAIGSSYWRYPPYPPYPRYPPYPPPRPPAPIRPRVRVLRPPAEPHRRRGGLPPPEHRRHGRALRASCRQEEPAVLARERAGRRRGNCRPGERAAPGRERVDRRRGSCRPGERAAPGKERADRRRGSCRQAEVGVRVREWVGLRRDRCRQAVEDDRAR